MANSLPHPQNRQPVSHIRGLAISGAFAAAVMALSLSGVGCSGTPAPEGGTGQPTSAPVMPTKPSPQVNAQKFVYGHQHPRQHGYLVTPKKLSPAKKIPLVVFFHGGGWQEKSTARSAAPVVNDLAQHGVAVWNVEYRGVTLNAKDAPGGWPMTYNDVAAAIDFIPQLAHESRIPLDISNVVVAGYSAGGNLSTWACSRPALPAKAPGAAPKFRVDKCVGIAGVYDMHLAFRQHDKFVRTLLGGTPRQVPQRYFEASPADNVNDKARIVVLHGKNDKTVNADEVKYFMARARAHGLSIETVLLDDAEHYSWSKPEGLQWKAARKAILQQIHTETNP